MRLVILESPYAGDVDANLAYARAAMRDCLRRGESPIASHTSLTQPGVLDDYNPGERELGIIAGWEWYRVAEACVVYTDHGISPGMNRGIRMAWLRRVPVEYRTLPKDQK